MRVAWLGFFGALAASNSLFACGNDHEGLVGRSGGGAGGNAGNANAGAIQSSHGGLTVVGHGGDGTAGVAGRAPDEPPGETVLTIVHGIVDAGSTQICFTQGNGSELVAYGSPVPAGGLDYGHSLVLRDIDGFDFKQDAFGAVVISGQIDLIAGLDCTSAIALAKQEQAAAEPAAGGAGGASSLSGSAGATIGGSAGASDDSDAGAAGAPSKPLPPPPRLRVGQLPNIPAGSLSGGRSYLLVADGCLGGPAFDDKQVGSICGERYSTVMPTLSGVLVAMSRRTDPTKLGLQVVNASLASGGVDVTLVPPTQTSAITVVQNVGYGGISPSVAEFNGTVADYGFTSPLLSHADISEVGMVLFTQPYPALLSGSDLAQPTDGQTVALIVLGPAMDFTRDGWWNARAVRAVNTDP